MSKDNRKKAVALRYEEDERNPSIVASGAGEIAKRILELAYDNSIPVSKDESLVEILTKLDLGYEISSEAYKAVAEVLAFLYRTEVEYKKFKGISSSDAEVLEAPETSSLYLPEPE